MMLMEMKMGSNAGRGAADPDVLAYAKAQGIWSNWILIIA